MPTMKSARMRARQRWRRFDSLVGMSSTADIVVHQHAQGLRVSSWRISRMMMQVRRDGMVGVLPAGGQINHRHHGAAQVDHPTNKGWHHGNLGDPPYSMISFTVRDADAKHLARQAEG